METPYSTSLQVAPASDSEWSTQARHIRTRMWRSITALVGLAGLIVVLAFTLMLNPGFAHRIMLPLMGPPILLEGFGAVGMAFNAFLNAAKALRGASIKCTSGFIKLIETSAPVWSSRLEAIELVAILAPRGVSGRLIPKMLLIQTSETAEGGGPLWRPSPTDYDPPYHGASPRSILLPDLFEIKANKIATRLADREKLTVCEIVTGVPNTLRVVQAWSRSEKANVRHESISLQRWRMFTGVCPVCRTRLPVLKWLSIFSNRACHQCGTSLRRHASLIPVGLTTALATSMIMLVLRRSLSLGVYPVAYNSVFVAIFFTLAYTLTRSWSRFSAEVQSGNHCRECGYDLRGCTDDRCSECGTPTSKKSNVATDPPDDR